MKCEAKTDIYILRYDSLFVKLSQADDNPIAAGYNYYVLMYDYILYCMIVNCCTKGQNKWFDLIWFVLFCIYYTHIVIYYKIYGKLAPIKTITLDV